MKAESATNARKHEKPLSLFRPFAFAWFVRDLPFELHVALRYLLAKRKQAFISVISFISTLGVTVGVMAVIIALAVMTGLQQELRDRIFGSNPHIYVSKAGGIED